MPHLLLVDDDRELCALLEDFLRLEGFEVSSIHDGAEAIELCKNNPFDALVLDIMLPGLQGLEVLRKLREFTAVPVLMLTARGADTDRILGLELGADDYLPKPANPRELSARLRAVLRRAAAQGSDDTPVSVTVDQTCVNFATRSATQNTVELALTSAEFNILAQLLKQAGHVVDKETLCEQSLGRPLTAYDRSVDVHVSKLRKKLAEQGADDVIISVRGVGYQFKREAVPS